MIRVRSERHFVKMSGSGNDFVFVDNVEGAGTWSRSAEEISRICDRRMGVGADGVVFLDPSETHLFSMVYLNSDGSRAAFCGNAALCSTRLATALGLAGDRGGEFTFESDYGPITARIHSDGQPEVDLPPVGKIRQEILLPLSPGELQAGMALVGVPHLVVLCESADQTDLMNRGALLRHHPLTEGGANVDFISAGSAPGEWRMRTYERGVEAETLACGSGAVASALLATMWDPRSQQGASGDEVLIRTSSGLPLVVRNRLDVATGAVYPSLRGEGRIVFEGDLRP